MLDDSDKCKWPSLIEWQQCKKTHWVQRAKSVGELRSMWLQFVPYLFQPMSEIYPRMTRFTLFCLVGWHFSCFAFYDWGFHSNEIP